MPIRVIGFIIVPCALLAQPQVSFDKEIRPILNRACVGCHQPASKQSGLLLTSHADFLKGGTKGPGFVAGKPTESVVIRYLTGEVSPQMPFGGKPLPPAEIDLFRRWISEGAKDDSSAQAAAPRVPKETQYRTPPLVTAVAFSPDGRTLAVSGYHEILLHTFDPATGETQIAARLPGLSQRIHSIAFSPDGKALAAVGGDPARMGELQIWDIASRKQRHSVVSSTDTFFGVAFSPDGTRVAFTGADKSIRLYDVASGKEIRKMDHHEDWAFGAVFGVDGKRLVTVGRDRAAKLTEAETGRFVENVNLLKDSLTAIARHPKRDWVLIGGAERIPYLYRMDRPRAMRIADDSTLIRKFDKQDGPILAVAFSADGSAIAVSAETGPVRVYNAETGELMAACSGHEGAIYTLAFHPSATRLVAAGFDGMIRVYDFGGKLVRAFAPVPLSATTVAREGRP